MINLKRTILLGIIVSVFYAFPALAELKQSGDFKYAIENYSKEATEDRYGACIFYYVATASNAILEVPDEIEGYPVLEICNGTASDPSFFANSEVASNVTEVILPRKLETLHAIFGKCESLVKITNPSDCNFPFSKAGINLSNWYVDEAGKQAAGFIPSRETIYKIKKTSSAGSSGGSGSSGSGGGGSSSKKSSSKTQDSNVQTGLVTINPYVYGGNWEQVNSRWALRISDGSLATSQWAFWNNEWYLIGNDSFMLTGWQLVNGKWYYMAPSGEMLTGWRFINDKWYYMDASGAMYANTTTPDGYRVNENGEWVQ